MGTKSRWSRKIPQEGVLPEVPREQDWAAAPDTHDGQHSCRPAILPSLLQQSAATSSWAIPAQISLFIAATERISVREVSCYGFLAVQGAAACCILR